MHQLVDKLKKKYKKHQNMSNLNLRSKIHKNTRHNIKIKNPFYSKYATHV